MKQNHLKAILKSWNLDIALWDGAGVHQGKDFADPTGHGIVQPVYSPKLTLAERIFEEIPPATVYPSLLARRHAVDDCLINLAAHPAAIKPLCYWHWIGQSLCVT